jgi:alkaline phosphatase
MMRRAEGCLLGQYEGGQKGTTQDHQQGRLDALALRSGTQNLHLFRGEIMTLRRNPIAIAVLTVLLVLCVFAAQALANPGNNTKPMKPVAKNVIILIADGSGFNSRIATDYYQHGAAFAQTYENWPISLAVSTFAAGGSYDSTLAWMNFDWVRNPWTAPHVTESDMAATAIASGYKTDAGVSWVHLPTSHAVPNIIDYAEALGKATGVVTTRAFDDATPAGFAAHNTSRDNLAIANGIADEMIYSSKLEVVMGAGNPDYNNDGQNTPMPSGANKFISAATWTALKAGTIPGVVNDRGGQPEQWTLIQDRSAFQALAKGATPERVFGMAQAYETVQEKRSGDAWTTTNPHTPWEIFTTSPAVHKYTGTAGWDLSTTKPFEVPLTPNEPTLSEMSKAALNVLDNDPDGFVVMIEGGAVDPAQHDGRPGRMIEEMADFNAAVTAVMKWVDTEANWKDTLVIVTADHETGYVLGPNAGNGTPVVAGDPAVFTPVVNNGAGNMPGVGEYALDVNKAPNWMLWHTDSLVPLNAFGAGSNLFNDLPTLPDPVRGPYIDNTDIFKVMYQAIGSPPVIPLP